MMDLSQYIGLFVDEAKAHLGQCNNKLLELEHQPDNVEILNEIFRVAHTIKGMAATLIEFPYFEEITTLTHEMENLLDKLRNKDQLVTPRVIDVLFSCMDGLEILVENVSDPASAQDVPYETIHQNLLGVMGATAPVDATSTDKQTDSFESALSDVNWEQKYSQAESELISQAGQSGKNCFEVEVKFMSDCQMKSVRFMMILKELESMGDVLKTFPAKEDIYADKVGDKFIVTLITSAISDQVKEAVMSVAEIANAETFNLLGETTQKIVEEIVHLPTDTEPLEFSLPDFNDYDRLLLSEAHKQGMNTVVLGIHLFSGVLLKATRVTVILRALEKLGEIVKTMPSITDLEEERFGNFFQVVLITQESREKVVDTLLSIAEVKDSVDVASVLVNDKAEVFATDERGQVLENIAPAPVKPARPAAPPPPPPEERPSKAIHEIPPARDKLPEAPVKLHTPHKAPAPSQANKASQIVRVDSDKLDLLMTLVGELVINRANLNQQANVYKLPELSQAIAHLNTITAELQSVSMKLRMVPVAQTFDRFPRMVRDVAKSLGKEIEFVLEGAETELDRTLIDDIGNPLVHMIRNAADHGLETPDEREQAGKDRKGRLWLTARYDGNNVLIRVKDDGRGIDVSKLKKKAVEKNLISAEQAIKMDDQTALQLIFRPGLSTSEQINDISGRGVGMDAVKSQIENIGGRIELESVKGKGTQVTIKLPLTLAILKSLLTKVGNEYYAIPLLAVEEVTEVMHSDIQSIQNYQMSLIRGETVPVLSLAERLYVLEHSCKSARGLLASPMVIVRVAEKKYGLVVDELIGQEDIVIKPLSRTCNQSEYISGAATLGNGEIALIVNTEALVAA